MGLKIIIKKIYVKNKITISLKCSDVCYISALQVLIRNHNKHAFKESSNLLFGINLIYMNKFLF